MCVRISLGLNTKLNGNVSLELVQLGRSRLLGVRFCRAMTTEMFTVWILSLWLDEG